eukprot:175942-Rhodomonas_salina.2
MVKNADSPSHRAKTTVKNQPVPSEKRPYSAGPAGVAGGEAGGKRRERDHVMCFLSHHVTILHFLNFGT